ncbi:MAG: hypothetical protein LBI54_08475 [Lachnospiraceae bacterium]|jgi:hypothetical protein|nr:hypothetical protein [Lachnospiraceae bacterium]
MHTSNTAKRRLLAVLAAIALLLLWFPLPARAAAAYENVNVTVTGGHTVTVSLTASGVEADHQVTFYVVPKGAEPTAATIKHIGQKAYAAPFSYSFTLGRDSELGEYTLYLGGAGVAPQTVDFTVTSGDGDGDGDGDGGGEVVIVSPTHISFAKNYYMVEAGGEPVEIELLVSPKNIGLEHVERCLEKSSDLILAPWAEWQPGAGPTPDTAKISIKAAAAASARPGSRYVTITMAAQSGQAAYKTFAEVNVYAPAAESEELKLALPVTSAALNRAKGDILTLPVNASRPIAGLSVRLLDNKMAEIDKSLFAATVAGNNAIWITAGATARNTKNITVQLVGGEGEVLAAAPQKLAINISTKYPKITFAATALDLYNRKTTAKITAISSDGAACTVEKVEVIPPAKGAALAITHGLDGLELADGANKTGSVKVRVTVSSPDYERLAKNNNTAQGTVFATTVKIANSDPKIKAPNKAGAMTVKGKIDITNPESAFIAMPRLTAEQGGIAEVALGGSDAGKAEAFAYDPVYIGTGESDTRNAFLLKAKTEALLDGSIQLGKTYAFEVSLAAANGETIPITKPKPWKIKLVQQAAKAFQSKREITLYKNTPQLCEDIVFGLTAPANAELGAVTIDKAGMDKLKLDNGGFEIVRSGENTWGLRFKGGVAPAKANGKNLKASYTVKLQLWPVGTYSQLSDDNQTAVMIAKAKPTVVSVKVYVR